MNILDIILIGISLSMDAMSVAICKGMSETKKKVKKSIVIALYFGLFQAIMPLLGYFLARNLQILINKIDHWIAFILLIIIGIKIIKDAILNENTYDDDISLKIMLPLAIATSIDAFAIGISLSFLNVDLLFSITCIGIITFILSFIGVKLGNRIGERFGIKSQLLGGFILIVIGFKILLEHLKLI